MFKRSLRAYYESPPQGPVPPACSTTLATTFFSAVSRYPPFHRSLPPHRARRALLNASIVALIFPSSAPGPFWRGSIAALRLLTYYWTITNEVDGPLGLGAK